MAARSKACVYGRSLAGIVGSNPSVDMAVCILQVFCGVCERSLHRADLSSREVLPNVVCLNVMDELQRGHGLLGLSRHEEKEHTAAAVLHCTCAPLLYGHKLHNAE